MKRKYIYGALAVPFVAFLLFLLVIPGDTRSMFFGEFKQRIDVMIHGEPEATPGDMGLRLEHPEEYGPQPGGNETLGPGDRPESDDDAEAANDAEGGDEDAVSDEAAEDPAVVEVN